MPDEFVVVLGRFTPLGAPSNQGTKRNHRPKMTVRLSADGSPAPECQHVMLERIVTPFEPSISKEQAEKEFSDLYAAE